MSIQKQLARIDLTGGVEKAVDDNLVIPAKLTQASNVVFDDANSVRARYGDTSYVASTITGTVKRAFPHQNSLLVEHTAGLTRVNQSSGTATNALIAPTYKPIAEDTTTPPQIITRASAQTGHIGTFEKIDDPGGAVDMNDLNCDSATGGGLSVWVRETGMPPSSGSADLRQAGLIVQVYREATKELLYTSYVRPTTEDVDYRNPRIVFVNSKFFLYYLNFDSSGSTAAVLCREVTSTAVGSANTAFVSTLPTSTEYNTPFDVAVTNNGVRLGLVIVDDDDHIVFIDLSTTDGYTTNATVDTIPASRPEQVTACYSYDATTYRLTAIYSRSGETTLKAACMTSAGVATAETAVDNSISSLRVFRIAAVNFSNSYVYVAYDMYGESSDKITVTRFCRFSPNLTADIGFNYGQHMMLAGKFILYGSIYVLPLMLPLIPDGNGLVQSTLYLIDASEAWRQNFVASTIDALGSPGPAPQVIGRIDYGECAYEVGEVNTSASINTYVTTRLPSGFATLRGVAVPYLKFSGDVITIGGEIVSPVALSRVDLDFESQLGHLEVNNVTYLAGGCPQVFDGELWTEEGFHHAPEIGRNSAPSAAGAGATILIDPVVEGTYYYVITVSWVDAQGNYYESAPSEQHSAVNDTTTPYLALGGTVRIPATQKPGAKVNVYRTLIDSTDTTLYLTARLPYVSNWSTYTSDEGAPDSTLATSEQLYTTGGILPNTPMPNCRQLALFQRRIAAAGCNDGYRVHWSKQMDAGFGVEWASDDPTHSLLTPQSLGRSVAVQEVDDRLFIMCENGVGAIYGSGPAPTGTQGEYSPFNTLTAEIGLNWYWPRSVVRIPDGVMFGSLRGLRAIGRNGAILKSQNGDYLGSESDPYVVGDSLSADIQQNLFGTTQANSSQAYFYTFTEKLPGVVVYDFEWNQWTTFEYSSSEVIDGCTVGERRYIVGIFSTVRWTGSGSNAGSQYSTPATIATSWLQFAGIQGFQRVSSLTIVGSATGATSLSFTISVAYNYDNDFTAIGTGLVVPVTASGADGYTFQLEQQLPIQKCQAMKFKLEWNTVSDSVSYARISNMALTVGIKKGSAKLGSAVRF